MLRLKDNPSEALSQTWKWLVMFVMLFWVGYVAITLAAGFATSITIGSEVWQLTAWGFISSAGLLALSRLMMRIDKGPESNSYLTLSTSSLSRFSIGIFLGAASFGIHIAVVVTFAGPISFEWVPEVGVMAAAIYFVRFLATSCMEEVGFRGYTLQRLTAKMGVWPAVWITAIAFGLSHLLYGWDMQTIALGVVPGGLLWGMSAIATRGLAVPIGLHAAWNFSSWSAGNRAETGLLHMIVDEDALQQTQAVGTVSYLAIFGVLTIAFWFVHRRNVQKNAPL